MPLCHKQVVLEAARRDPAYQQFLQRLDCKKGDGLTDVEFISLACLMQAKMGRVRRRGGIWKRWTGKHGACQAWVMMDISQNSQLCVHVEMQARL